MKPFLSPLSKLQIPAHLVQPLHDSPQVFRLINPFRAGQVPHQIFRIHRFDRIVPQRLHIPSRDHNLRLHRDPLRCVLPNRETPGPRARVRSPSHLSPGFVRGSSVQFLLLLQRLNLRHQRVHFSQRDITPEAIHEILLHVVEGSEAGSELCWFADSHRGIGQSLHVGENICPRWGNGVEADVQAAQFD